MVIAWELGALAFLQWTTVPLFSFGPATAVAHGSLLVLLWVLGSWRVVGMGVYVNDRAVSIRRLLSTSTVPWQRVERIVIEPVLHRLGPLAIPGGDTVVLHLWNGTRVNTALWAEGIDFHGRPDLFRRVYQRLRRRHLTATTRHLTVTTRGLAGSALGTPWPVGDAGRPLSGAASGGGAGPEFRRRSRRLAGDVGDDVGGDVT